MTPFELHRKAWKDCELCPLHRTRRHVVLCRGKLPADVLFVGEGPGESEDLLGVPFIGPAGKLLDKWIRLAGGEEARKCWTNLVGCFPIAEDTKRKKAEPLPAEIASCWPRLDEFIDICKPKRIVAVGDLATKQATNQLWGRRAPIISITHPGAILKMGGKDARVNLLAQRAVVQLRTLFEELRSA